MQVLLNYAQFKEGIKQHAVVNATVLAVGAGQVSISYGVDVPEYRQVEIYNAWDMLKNGISDRLLLDDQFKGSALVTSVDIDRITAPGRSTNADQSSVTATSVVVELGADVTADGDINMIFTAFDWLRAAALEQWKVRPAA